MNAPVTQNTPPSIVTEAALQQQTAEDTSSDILEVTSDEGLDLTDIADIAESQESGIDVKATSDFLVVFRNAEGKKIKGQSDAAENICCVRFACAIGGTAVSADGPKKRGRKSDAEKAAKVHGSQMTITFWDDDQNVSVDFLESLSAREEFIVEVFSVNEAREPLEVFTFEGCSVVPLLQYHEFSNKVPSTPRSLSVSVSYEGLNRTSSNAETDE